jgi:hypothetical protein
MAAAIWERRKKRVKVAPLYEAAGLLQQIGNGQESTAGHAKRQTFRLAPKLERSGTSRRIPESSRIANW